MSKFFEFDFDEWISERDQRAQAHIAKLSDSSQYFEQKQQEAFRHANSTMLEELFVRHFIFVKRQKLFFGRSDATDENVLMAAAIDARGVSLKEAAYLERKDLILLLRGEISRTRLPEHVIDHLVNDDRFDHHAFSAELLAKHRSSPAPRR